MERARDVQWPGRSYAMATGKSSTSLLLELSEILSEKAHQLEQIATGASNPGDQSQGISDPGV